MPRVDARFPDLRLLHERRNLLALRSVFQAQRTGRTADPLMQVMFDQNMAAATNAGRRVARRFDGQFEPARMRGWLVVNASIGSERINDAIRQRIADVGAEQAFDELLTSRSAMYATSMAGMAINFGAKEGALQSGSGMKTWQTNSGNPRSSHAAMGGETVPVGEKFSNGMDWPGDPEGGAEEVANCECSLVFL